MEVQIGDIVYCWFPLMEYEVENDYHEPYMETDDILFGNYREGRVLKIEGAYNQEILIEFHELKDFNINPEIWFRNGFSGRFNNLNSKCNTLFISILPPKVLKKRYETKTKQILEELDFIDIEILKKTPKIAKKFEAFKKWAKNEIESI